MQIHAGVAELVDALDLGSSDESCGGSSPSARTKRLSRLHGLLRGLAPRGCFSVGAGFDEPPASRRLPRDGSINDSVPTRQRAGTEREEDWTPCRSQKPSRKV